MQRSLREPSTQKDYPVPGVRTQSALKECKAAVWFIPDYSENLKIGHKVSDLLLNQSEQYRLASTAK